MHLAYNTDDKIILMQSIKSAANYSKPFQKYKHFNKSILVSHIDCLFMAHVSVIRKLILMTKKDHYLLSNKMTTMSDNYFVKLGKIRVF